MEAQNAGRDRVVPPHIVREHHQLLPDAYQLHREGFAVVHPISELLATDGAQRR